MGGFLLLIYWQGVALDVYPPYTFRCHAHQPGASNAAAHMQGATLAHAHQPGASALHAV